MSRLAAVVGSLLLAATASAATVPRDNTAPTVRLANGSYYGLHSKTYKQDMFLSMPFAQPPVGDLRLRQPRSLNSTWQGSRNATEYGYECIVSFNRCFNVLAHVDRDCWWTNLRICARATAATSGPKRVPTT